MIYHPNDPAVLLSPEKAHLIAPKDRPLFEEAALRLGEGLERWFSSGSPIVVHHDLHQWNVKVFRGRLTPIDFEDFGWGHPIQDIGTALFYTRRDPARETLWAAFREGYTTIRPWPEPKPGDLELVLVRRILDFANYYAGATDPKFKDRAEARIAGGAEELKRWLGAGC